MEWYIYKPNFGSNVPTKIGVLQNAESAVWSNYSDEVGDVTIQAVMTDYNLEMLQKGNLIRKPIPVTIHLGESFENSQSYELYEIAAIDEIETNTSEQTMTVYARLLDGMLETRVNAAYSVVNGSRNFTTWFQSLLSTFTDQSQSRSLPMEYLGSTLTATIEDCSVAWDTLAEIIEKARAQNQGGGQHGVLYVRVFHSDAFGIVIVPQWSWVRTGVLDPVIYRYDKDDIDNVRINESRKDWSNVAFIAGEGEGAERTTAWYPASNSSIKGMNRRELFVDARDLSSEDYSTSAQYLKALRNRGKEKLVAQVETVEFEVARSDYTYGTDFYLGDVLGVVIAEISTQLSMPVSGAVESWDADGYSLALEFGQPKESFSRRINKRLK